MPDLRSSPSRLRLCAFLIVLAALLVASERVAWPNRPPLLDGRMLFGLWGVLLAGVTLVRPAPGSFGLGAGNPKHGLAALVLGLPVAVAGMAAFARVGSISAHYGAHPPEPLALLGLYAPGIVQVEVCFRGVIQFTLGRYLGATEAICLATIPYALVHLDKPIAESLGAIPVGLALGCLAQRCRSIWPGTLLHVAGAIALTEFASRR